MIVKANLRSGGSRLIAAGITVVVSVAFVVAVTCLLSAFNATMRNQFSVEYAGADLVVTPADQELTKKAEKKLADVDGVKEAQVIEQGVGYTVSDEFVAVSTWPSHSELPIVDGKAPSNSHELLYDAKMAKKQGIKVGDTVELVVPSEDGNHQDKVSFTVSGISQVPSPIPLLFTTDVSEFSPWVDHVRILVDDPANVSHTQDAVARALADSSGVKTEDTGSLSAGGLEIFTVDQLVQSKMKELTGDSQALVGFIIAFIAVALFVAVLVISNTFQVLVASRTRSLALLRAVGATRSQLRNATLAEGAALGVISAVVGVLAGWGVAVVLSLLAQRFVQPNFVLAPLTLVAVALGLVVGVSVTVIASFFPAIKATRVSPIQALAPADIPAPVTRFPWIRLVIGTLLFAVGVVALIFGAVNGLLLIALPGGFFAFCGVLVLCRVFVPPLVSVTGLAGEAIFRSPGLGLVARNIKLSPRRTASTTSALLVGVTLVATILVGAQTTRITSDTELSLDEPIDVVVTPASAKAVAAVKKSDIVRNSVEVPGVMAKTTVPLGQAPDGSESTLIQVVGVDDTADVPRTSEFLPEPGIVTVRETADNQKYNGKPLDFSVGNQKVTLTVRTVQGAPQNAALANLDDVKPLGLEKSSGQVWIRATDSTSVQDLEKFTSEVGDEQTVVYSGGASLRIQFEQVLNILTAIILALLATSVVISIVGVGNTLSLATMERKRETALLRALGMSRSSTAFMVTAEAVLMAIISLVVGLGLGILFGWAGVSSLLSQGAITVTLGIPWLMFGAVAIVALIAAGAASILPAIAASRTQPAQGVATD